jgi:hypothetical protein
LIETLKRISKHFSQLAVCGVSQSTLQIRTGSYILNIPYKGKTGSLDVKLLKKGILTTNGNFELATPPVEPFKDISIKPLLNIDFEAIVDSPYDYVMFRDGIALGTNTHIAVWAPAVNEVFGLPIDSFKILKALPFKTFKLAHQSDNLCMVAEGEGLWLYTKLYKEIPNIRSKLPERNNFVYIKRPELLRFFRGLLVYVSDAKPNVTAYINGNVLHVNDDCQDIETPKGFEHPDLVFSVLNVVKVLSVMKEPLCVSVPNGHGPLIFRTKTLFDELYGLVMPIILKPQESV